MFLGRVGLVPAGLEDVMTAVAAAVELLGVESLIQAGVYRTPNRCGQHTRCLGGKFQSSTSPSR